MNQPTEQPVEKKPRQPTAYNIFMKTEIQRVKETQPELDQKQRFTTAANNWKTSPQNVKAGK